MLQAPPPKLTTTFSSSDFSTDSDNNNSSSKQSSNTDAPWELSPRAKLALTQVFEKYSNGNGMSLQDIAVYSQACQSSSMNNVNPEMVSASTCTSGLLKLCTLALLQDTCSNTDVVYMLHYALQHRCRCDSAIAYS
jgi:hypothetical protein